MRTLPLLTRLSLLVAVGISFILCACCQATPGLFVPGLLSAPKSTALSFTAASSTAISVATPDGAPLKVTVACTEGRLTLARTAGLSFLAGDGAADPSMTFAGAPDDINAALDGATYMPRAGYFGLALVQVDVDDLRGAPDSRVIDTIPVMLTSTAGGSVVAWGGNAFGQCTVPAATSGQVTSVGAGVQYSAARKVDGTLAAWGGNVYGQLTIPAGLSDVLAIEGGGHHALALRADGTVGGWGWNALGQCAAPVDITDAVSVAGGFTHSVALRRNGSVLAWGDAGGGKCAVPAGLRGVLALSACYDHTLALRNDGTVVGWGSNGYGQCSPPAGLSGVVAVAAGGSHSVALKGDGTVVAWGWNTYGQCNVPAGLSGVVSIAAGTYNSLAVKADGSVVVWGRNTNGQCNVPASARLIVSAAVGETHVLALQHPPMPSTIVLDPAVVAENLPAGSVVGTLAASGPSFTDTYAFSLANDETYPDNAAFAIDEAELRTTVVLDYEATHTYVLCVRATSTGGTTFDKVLTVAVTNVNEAPTADGRTVTVAEDTGVGMTLTASDPDGDPLTMAIVDGPQHGVLAGAAPYIHYAPRADFVGEDGFTFAVSDGFLTSTATVTITVTPVNDAPTAADRALRTPEDTEISIALTGDDVDGDALTVAVVTQPLHGTLTGSGATFVYMPASDYHGADSFQYVVSDGELSSAPATVTITVDPVNDPPVADAQAVAAIEDTPLTIILTGGDVDGDALTYVVLDGPTHGTLDADGAKLLYRPNPDYHGADALTFSVSDGVLSSTAVVTIAVTPVNDPPTAEGQALTTKSGVPVAIVLAGADLDGDALEYLVIDGPSHGVLSGTGANLVYTPAGDFTGIDRFTFVASDGQATSAEAVVFITVERDSTALNLPPVIETLNLSPIPVRAGNPIEALATFTDPNPGDTHTATWAWGDGSTTVGTIGSGAVTGTHRYARAGFYTVRVTVTDAAGERATRAARPVVAVDPEAGFITGGGWFQSAPGAYHGDSTVAGKAHFAFAVAYLPGIETPQGITAFSLTAGNMRFTGYRYDWLVVDGTTAWCSGMGRVNGQGQYRFLLAIQDNKGITGKGKGKKLDDNIRVSIWDAATGARVYDTQAGAPLDAQPRTTLGGGNATVHGQ